MRFHVYEPFMSLFIKVTLILCKEIIQNVNQLIIQIIISIHTV